MILALIFVREDGEYSMTRKAYVFCEEVVPGGILRVVESRRRVYTVSVYDGILTASSGWELLGQYERDQLVLDLGRDWIQDQENVWANYHDDAMERRGSD